MIELRDLDLAEKAIRRVLELSPESEKDAHNLAGVLAEQNKWKEAREACKRALEIAPGAPNSARFLKEIERKLA